MFMLKIFVDYIRSPVSSRYSYITSGILLVASFVNIFIGEGLLKVVGYYGFGLGILWFLVAMLKARKGK